MSSDIVYPDRGPTVLSVTVTTLCIASVFVAARMVSRLGIVKHTTWDDYTIILAWAIAFGSSFAIAYGTGKGLGRVDADIKPSWEGALMRCEYAFSILYNPALMATKTSILIFYLRMARNTNNLFRLASYATLFVVNVAGLVLTLLNIFQCRPLTKLFDSNDNTQTCIPLITLYLASSPVNIITDLVILVLPIPILTRMSLPRKQKNILVATFGLGIFVAIVDVVRIYYLQQAMTDVLLSGKSVKTTNGLGDEADFEYNASYSLMWSAVEVNVGIICACVPTLKPLIKRVMPKLIDHSKDSSPTYTAPESKIEGISSDYHSPPMAQFESMPTADSLEAGNMSPMEEPGLARTRTNQEIEIDMLDFLTVAGERRRPSVAEHSMAQSDAANSVYFGFVNMRRPKSMLQTGVKDSIRYCVAVTVLFFLWGFSYGLLNTLNIQVAAVAKITAAQGLGLQSAYFGAYLFGPLTLGRYILCRSGFKTTFIVGLCIYGTGTLMFWPSAVLIAYPGFVISNFVVGFGLSILETAANPFLALCGPPQYGESRLLLAQGVQGVGAVVSQLIAEKAFFDGVEEGHNLIDVQWAYLAIAFFDVLLALFFYYMPLPEASDDELHVAAQPRFLPLNKTITQPSPTTHIGKFRVVFITLGLAVCAQFLYVGVQETLSIYFSSLVLSLTPPSDPGAGLALSAINYICVGHAAFAASRFAFGIICLWIRPRIMLLVSFIGAIAMTIVIISLPSSDVVGKPNTIAALCIMLWFFEGPLWPLIYAIALRKLGRATKTGAALITAGAFGGAVSPWFMYAASESGVNIRRAFFLLVIALALGLIFPLYLCLIPRAREQVDCIGDTEGEQADYGEAAMTRMSRVSANGIAVRERAAGPLPRLRRGTVGSMAKVGGEVRMKSVANVKRIVVGVRGLFGSHSSQGSGDEHEGPNGPDLSRQY